MMKVEGMKKKNMHKGKAGDMPAGWVRPIFVFDEDDRLIH